MPSDPTKGKPQWRSQADHEMILKLIDNNVDLESKLGNLLAVLNGDGGHYQQEHGLDAAIQRGIDRFHSKDRS